MVGIQAAISDATHTIHSVLRVGAWTVSQRQRLHQLDPGTWPQAARARPRLAVQPLRQPIIEIAIYPEIVRLAAHNLRAQEPGAAVMMVKHVRAVMGAAASAALVNRAG
jgi:hypothetical protein